MIEPIFIPCEGSGCPPCRTAINPATFSYNGGEYVGLCSMCGTWQPVLDGGGVGHHKRQDVLAMIERGDFGSSPTAASETAGETK